MSKHRNKLEFEIVEGKRFLNLLLNGGICVRVRKDRLDEGGKEEVMKDWREEMKMYGAIERGITDGS